MSVLWLRVPLQSEPSSEDLPISRAEPWSLQEGGSGGAGGGCGGPGPSPRQAASPGPLSHCLLSTTALRLPGPHGRCGQCQCKRFFCDLLLLSFKLFLCLSKRIECVWTFINVRLSFIIILFSSPCCQVTQIISQQQVQAELTLRLTQLQTRLASLKIENEEVGQDKTCSR